MCSARPSNLSSRVLQEQARFRRFGLGLLLAGVMGSAAVFAVTQPTVDDYYMPETKKADYQMEVIAGKGNMLATETTQWVSDQWHGRKLARTILILSLVLSGGCFFIAHRLKYGPAAADAAE